MNPQRTWAGSVQQHRHIREVWIEARDLENRTDFRVVPIPVGVMSEGSFVFGERILVLASLLDFGKLLGVGIHWLLYCARFYNRLTVNIVVLTGAGISRESGIKTFRDSDGLWAGHRIEDVCTPMALAKDPQRVLDFYNMRRREVASVEPNAGHFALAELERDHQVTIITQNIDDLHERAGSTRIIHIHGEIFKSRSMNDETVQFDCRGDINLGDLAPDQGQLRPHICFFHEMPFHWDRSQLLTMDADIFVVVGTSLAVYPAAGLVDVTRAKKIYVIDPNPPQIASRYSEIISIAEPATTGVPRLLQKLQA